MASMGCLVTQVVQNNDLDDLRIPLPVSLQLSA